MPAQVQTGAGAAASRAASRVASASATASRADRPLWSAIASRLDAATAERIARFVDRQARARRAPAQHPAVQELRSALLGRSLTQSAAWRTEVRDYVVALDLIGPARDTIKLLFAPAAAPDEPIAQFFWNWETIPDGAHVYRDYCTPSEERLFYAILAVVLSRVAAVADAIGAALPTMNTYIKRDTASGGERVVKTQRIATRIRKLYADA